MSDEQISLGNGVVLNVIRTDLAPPGSAYLMNPQALGEALAEEGESLAVILRPETVLSPALIEALSDAVVEITGVEDE